MTQSSHSTADIPAREVRPQGTILPTLLVGTLGLAVVAPGLLLQGVAGRVRPAKPEPDTADGDPVLNGHGRRATVHSVDDTQEQDASGRQPRRGRDRPAASQGGAVVVEEAAPAGTVTQRDQRRQARELKDGRAQGSALERPSTPGAGNVTSELVTVDETALTETNDEGETEDGPRQPVSFTEVQAAHLAAAHAFRDMRRSLNEAYRLIGRLNIERYEALSELAELKDLPAPERPPDRSWNTAARPSALAPSRPLAPAGARRVKRAPDEPEEEDVVDEAEVKAIARRRQMTVLGIVAAVAGFAVIYRLLSWNWFPNLMNPQEMAQIAGIGVMMQIFFLVFFLFRLTTLTGKGKNWLFPNPQEEAWKRRRKRIRGR